MKILVTGGAGFIGHHLVGRLRGHHLRVVDDLSTGDAGRLDPAVEFSRASILDAGALAANMRGVDAVVHLAAIASVPESIARPYDAHEVNATGTMRVLEAARKQGVGRVILASSAAVYGGGASNEEDAPTRPLSPYGASKVAAEAYAAAYAATWGMDVTVLRLFNVYGPGQSNDHPHAPVVARFVRQALAGQPIPIYGDGRQSREFVHVYTVCDLIDHALRSRWGWPTPVNVAFGQPTALGDLVRGLEGLLGRALPVEVLPPRRADIYRSGATGNLLADLLGREGAGLEPVSLYRGLASMIPRELVWA